MLRSYLRPVLATFAMLCAVPALAAEAGKIIFVAGAAQVAGKPAVLNAAVQEGELLTTGAAGYIYIKTVDNGMFILRPNTEARIASYHIDAANPANTRIKLELLHGVARSQSGEAVKLARQNFRFNTPVAAIGVRGTDFTVFTDQEVSRVAVLSGGITMSGFGGGCRPEGSGPCEGAMARELSASQRGQLLQVQRSQAAPQLLQGGSLAPDMVAPPRPDEPSGKLGGAAAATGAEPSLDPRKANNLQQLVATQSGGDKTNGSDKSTESNPVPVVPVVPVVPSEPVVVAPVIPPRAVNWGRWQAVAGQATTATLAQAGADRLAFNDAFVLFRAKEGSQYVTPEHGSVGFNLNQSEAYVRNQSTSVSTLASVENGKLLVDFDKSQFITSFDLLTQGERIALKNTGEVARDGQLYGGAVLGSGGVNTINVNGVLSGKGDATYLFQGRLDATRTVSGVTYWTK